MLIARKIIIGLFAFCFVTWVITAIGLQLYYYSNLPRTPDQKTGRIYQIVVNHGSIRYGSEQEIRVSQVVDNCQMPAIFLFVTAILIGLKYGHLKVRDDSHNRLP